MHEISPDGLSSAAAPAAALVASPISCWEGSTLDPPAGVSSDVAPVGLSDAAPAGLSDTAGSGWSAGVTLASLAPSFSSALMLLTAGVVGVAAAGVPLAAGFPKRPLRASCAFLHAAADSGSENSTKP